MNELKNFTLLMILENFDLFIVELLESINEVADYFLPRFNETIGGC